MNPDRHARSILPIPDRPATGADDVRRQGPGHLLRAHRAAATAPAGPPTSWSMLLDDVGFGADVGLRRPLPDAHRRAAGGGRVELQPVPHHRRCAPTRQALLTGRNHHPSGMGSITETAGATLRTRVQLGAPEHQGRGRGHPADVTGYPTAQFGKCHEVPVWQPRRWDPSTPGPPAVGGFETFYGFIGGETQPVRKPRSLQRHRAGRAARDTRGGLPLTEDITDRAIMGASAEGPDGAAKPFFVYYAPAPPTRRTTCRRSGRTSTLGQFDDGWDALREDTSPASRSSASYRRRPS